MTEHSVAIQSGNTGSAYIRELLLDETNPRFGELERGAEQSQLVDLVIQKFGIDDVLSSLAMNGFYSAEPLVCTRKEDGSLVVKEGNRRLCACIVLTADPRAIRQENRTKKAARLWEENGRPPIEPIPILVFDEHGEAADKMLSYLGVRHISGAQPWDSYAKASWVAKITDETQMPVAKITEMIGDQHSTVVRLLEGYRFMRQLIESGNFKPEDSQRSGRGSVTEYPFSWVYTILGFKAARNFCGLGDITGKPNPVPEAHLDDASTVVTTMFGNKSIGRPPAITDSRELSELAGAFSDPEKVSLLRTGKDLAVVQDLTKPIERKLEENLSQVRSILQGIVSSISEAPPSFEVAEKHVSNAAKTRQLSNDVYRRLKAIVDREFEDDDD